MSYILDLFARLLHEQKSKYPGFFPAMTGNSRSLDYGGLTPFCIVARPSSVAQGAMETRRRTCKPCHIKARSSPRTPNPPHSFPVSSRSARGCRRSWHFGVEGTEKRYVNFAMQDLLNPPCRMAVWIRAAISISGQISRKFAPDFEISRTGQYKYTHRPRKIGRWGEIPRKLNAEMDALPERGTMHNISFSRQTFSR